MAHEDESAVWFKELLPVREFESAAEWKQLPSDQQPAAFHWKPWCQQQQDKCPPNTITTDKNIIRSEHVCLLPPAIENDGLKTEWSNPTL